ncbi:DUF3253 domain-containing protein [Streptomyces sp. SID486]|uniref:DUF3253 domain-containing protein n=1 Tax=unclassified Streptomyces TaxID=2593676 RepID=UPI001369FCE8|nr:MULTISPECIES: DUF3253 domain-containing protein [unclassified Streptomyces]MYW47498.1 DUF3253 domain-containing protein [Streptomyces sp. SID161]MYX98006.1 DUF3253 domain-containing protein [Streptomyces sp. SID486]
MPDGERSLEDAILDLLDRRAPGASVCPSDVARAVHGSGDEGWRELMEPVRRAAARLAAEGRVEVTQHGDAVDPARARGPVRIRRPG